MTELHRWDVELKCVGYYGFGGGYAKAKDFTYEGDQVYCGVCPIGQECWDKHKKRTGELLPAMTEEFESRAKGKEGPELMEEWWEEFQTADPYTIVMGGNLEDGMSVAFVGVTKDRGPFTLTWPLEVRE